MRAAKSSLLLTLIQLNVFMGSTTMWIFLPLKQTIQKPSKT